MSTRLGRLAGPILMVWLFLASLVPAGAQDPAPPDVGGLLDLAVAELDLITRGCDPLDTSHCLFPFPSNQFTREVAPHQVGGSDRGGTGRRISISPLAMPTNVAGKPIDPTEWNRNDGFSPGQMLMTYVEGLDVVRDQDGSPAGPIPGAPSINDVARYLDPNSPVVVIDTHTGRRHPVWAETDVNAGYLFPPGGEPKPGDARPALIIRPASNFLEGHRYVVALRHLPREGGGRVPAPSFFATCRDGRDLAFPTLADRCDDLSDNVLSVLAGQGIPIDDSLYLAWDFTVASPHNNVGRLQHMRDDAFNRVLGQVEDEQGRITNLGEAPDFEIGEVRSGEDYLEIHGSTAVPSYLIPQSPLPTGEVVQTLQETTPEALQEATDECLTNFPVAEFCEVLQAAADAVDEVTGAAGSLPSTLSIPPNRLFYNPADELHLTEPGMQPFGDGLPDQTGTMSVPFMCRLYDGATPDDPARAGIYGHGLLDQRRAITYDRVPQFSRDANFMFCAVDWFGFAFGDIANVASTLLDLSLFPVVPDASQQGMLNQLFLARLLRHPNGLASHPAFQDAGRPRFDNSEIFYHGISQGGILGGVVVAMSKDISRGLLGVPGMNYSTLLRRSTGFSSSIVDPIPVGFSTPLYLAYPDDLDRPLALSLVQMLWDRSENNGYAHHITDNTALGGPDNEVLLRPAFADHQVSHWSAQVMARTLGVDLADVYPRLPEACASGEAAFCYETREQWHTERDPDVNLLYGLPLAGNQNRYDRPANPAGARSGRSGLIQWDQGRTAVPPLAEIPPNWRDSNDPHSFPRDADGSFCQQSHFLHSQGRLIDAGPVIEGGPCPHLPRRIGSPGDKGPPGRLLAGVAKQPLRVPVGVPLGGYLRPPVGGEYVPGIDGLSEGDPELFLEELLDFVPTEGPDGLPQVSLPDELRTATSPYATVSPPSRGYFDSLTTKAVALYDGSDHVVLVKTDLIGMLDELVKAVAEDVWDRTAADPQGFPEGPVDLSEGLIMSASHSHAGPGALANHSARYFWAAMDVYQPELFERLVPQFTDVVMEALGNLQPARIGHASGQESYYDPVRDETRHVNGFRRARLPHYDLEANEALRNRIGLLRVDTLQGEPLAVVINYAAHGIVFDVENLLFSGDALGAVERNVEASFPDSPDVVAMLVQNTGGDVSPRVDGLPKINHGASQLQRIERFGKLMAPQVMDIHQGIEDFQTNPRLRAVSQHFVLSLDSLGYDPGEYPYPWGAGQCNNDVGVPLVGPSTDIKNPVCLPGPPPDPLDLADNGVAENGAFFPQDTRISAVQIGDILLLTQPGEPVTEYGVRVLSLAERLGYERDDTFIWGYAQDHIGYVLPPERDDWLMGGTEGTTTFWGWKQGQRFLEVQEDLMRALRDGTPPPPNELEPNYYYRDLLRLVPRPQVAVGVHTGRVIEQPADIERFQTTQFSWNGRDPLVDLPHVVMERETGTGWAPMRRPNGEVIDTFGEMQLHYRLVSGAHQWTVVFEPPYDWPAGRYRFRVAGTTPEGERSSYTATSDAFEVKPSPTLRISEPRRDGDTVTVTLAYEPRRANYRIIDPLVQMDRPAPVREGRVVFSNGQTTVEAGEGELAVVDGLLVARYSAEISGDVIVAEGQDAFGNTTSGPAWNPDVSANALIESLESLLQNRGVSR